MSRTTLTRISPATLAGVHPVKALHTLENHDEAFRIWEKAEVKNRTLVHIDGHLDFYWIPEKSPDDLSDAPISRSFKEWIAETEAWNLSKTPLTDLMTIGNFLYPAMREQMVNQIYWVVPDPFWASPPVRRQVARSLQAMLKNHPLERASLKETHRSITLTLLGCPVTVCPLRELPSFRQPVLLDIDTDYLLTSLCDYVPVYYSNKTVIPWQTPKVFLERLATAAIPTDLITIAYSVDGGYTPLAWKFYGDQIAQGLRQPAVPLLDNPTPGQAAESYRETLDAVDRQDVEQAAKNWQKTIERDPTYRTIYALPAYREEAAHRWVMALGYYDLWVRMDPTWYYPHLGRGRSLWHLGLIPQAETALETACQKTTEPTMAWYWLGRCAVRREDWQAARSCLRRALDYFPYNPEVWWAWAGVAEKCGERAEARRAADQCRSLGYEPVGLTALIRRLKTDSTKQKGPSMNLPNLQTVYQRKSSMITRRVAGEIILVPIQPRLSEDPALFTLDNVAAFLWDQLAKPTSGQALCLDLQDHFTVNSAQADQDVASFLAELIQIDAIEVLPAQVLTA